MTTTIERLDIDRLRAEINESVKYANGVPFPNDRETQKTIELIQKCWEGFHRGNPPMEGEWVEINGEHKRIAYVSSRLDFSTTTFQPAKAGSVYLFEGCGSFSGSLDSSVTMKLKHVGWKPAPFWVFYGGLTGARREVHFTIPTRVFAETSTTHNYILVHDWNGGSDPRVYRFSCPIANLAGEAYSEYTDEPSPEVQKIIEALGISYQPSQDETIAIVSDNMEQTSIPESVFQASAE